MNQQFTNAYNTQNGMNAGGNAMMGGNQNGMGMSGAGAWQTQSTQTQIPNDWRPYSSTPPIPAFNGKWVNSFDDIRPIDVPQDGSLTFFPQLDKSCIYGLTWGIDGRIQAFRFLPEKIEQPTQPTQNDISDPVKEVLMGFTTSMYDRMDALERRIGDILNRFETPTTSTNTKSKKNATGGEQQ